MNIASDKTLRARPGGATVQGGRKRTRSRGPDRREEPPSSGPSRRGAAAAPPPARARGRARACGRQRRRASPATRGAPAAAAAASRSRPWTRRPCRRPSVFSYPRRSGAARRRTRRRSRRAPRRRPALPPRAICRRAAGTRAAGLRIQARAAACRPSRCASKPVTKNSSTTSSTLWASRSRSKTTASLRRPRGAASRSGGAAAGPRLAWAWGACQILDVAPVVLPVVVVAVVPRRRRGGSPPSSRSAVVFLAAFLPVAAATAALASFFADLTREFARRRVGLIGFCGFASLGGGAPPGAAPPGVPLAPACSIVGGGRGARRRGRLPEGSTTGAGPRVRLLIRAELAPGGQGHEDAAAPGAGQSMVADAKIPAPVPHRN